MITTVPCSRCGAPAASLDVAAVIQPLRDMLDALGPARRIVKQVCRRSFDLDIDGDMTTDPAAVAQILQVRCIRCTTDGEGEDGRTE